jgi:hypothetical protein
VNHHVGQYVGHDHRAYGSEMSGAAQKPDAPSGANGTLPQLFFIWGRNGVV